MLTTPVRRLGASLVVAAGFFATAATWAQSGANDPPKPQFNEKGQLIRPEGFRKWVYIGTPLTPNDLNPPEAPFPDFHNVSLLSKLDSRPPIWTACRRSRRGASAGVGHQKPLKQAFWGSQRLNEGVLRRAA